MSQPLLTDSLHLGGRFSLRSPNTYNSKNDLIEAFFLVQSQRFSKQL